MAQANAKVIWGKHADRATIATKTMDEAMADAEARYFWRARQTLPLRHTRLDEVKKAYKAVQELKKQGATVAIGELHARLSKINLDSSLFCWIVAAWTETPSY